VRDGDDVADRNEHGQRRVLAIVTVDVIVAHIGGAARWVSSLMSRPSSREEVCRAAIGGS
jgi:hypothetical protein